ncbi:NUDIX hydrolase [Pseudonocardia nigra]|uniref:NUDIX hydrolase n=1 Tax=Pseudonocardia nigra TaxID=1921578 RepID=UPI001FE36A82|nr:NUDIX domain-containing protein [Pseudonocardia nigra]
MWLDSSGRALADYPHPSIAVDVALLTVVDDRQAVLLHEKDDGPWSLPGTFVRIDERLRDAALRALRDKAGVAGQEPEQLRVFDGLDRDSRGRVMSVAHVDLVPARTLETRTASLVPVDELPELAFDHREIVEAAVEWARAEYRERPDPRGLAGQEFTLLELQRVHEAVLGTSLQKDTFRRRMIDQLRETPEVSRGSVGKPARLFRKHTANQPN